MDDLPDRSDLDLRQPRVDRAEDVSAAIILLIVVLVGALGFWQELAVERLLSLVRVHADVRRDGADSRLALEA